MVKPAVLNPHASLLLLVLGGVLGTVVLSSMIYVAPALGMPSIEIPLLVGGIFTADRAIAFWLGYILFFLIGVFLFAPALGLLWPLLPGKNVGFAGAAMKGASWGAILAVAGGLALPLFGVWNQITTVPNPGLFGVSHGILGVAGVIGGHIIYGVVVALTGMMGQGIRPMETLGWIGHRHADVRQVGVSPAAKAEGKLGS